MSNEIVRTIVENIVNDKFDTLKEDLSKAVSAKAVNVLESKKAMVGKTFFDEMNETMKQSTRSVQLGKVPVAGRDRENVQSDIKDLINKHKDTHNEIRTHARGRRKINPELGTRSASPSGGVFGPNTKYAVVYGVPRKSETNSANSEK